MDNTIQNFLSKPYSLKMGSNKLAKWWGTTPEIVRMARKKAKQILAINTTKDRIPKVLLLDIETAPMQVFSWSLYKPLLNYRNIIKRGFMLSWAAKWLFSADMMSDVVTSKEAVKQDDKRISKSIWKLVDEADIVIGHNLRQFDMKWLNTEFILNGLKPPMPFQTIDTLIEARKHFRFPSNQLDYLGQLMTRQQKIATNFELWVKCINGDKESLGYMCKYNEQDVFLLEDVYVELRPWIRSHPSLGIYMNASQSVCENCGSVDLLWENKYYTTTASKFAAFRCNTCGAPNRCKTSVLNKEQRNNLLISTAR